jgi:YggT family protein
MDLVIKFVSILTTILWFAIFARAILSWFPMGGQGNNPIVSLVYQITEPVLAPLRSILPRVGSMDLSPMVAILILYVIQQVLGRL